MKEEEVIHEWYVGLGARTSERKQASSRANALKGAEARRGPSTCNCGRVDVTDPLKHKSTCRVYQSEKQRLRRAKKREEQEGDTEA